MLFRSGLYELMYGEPRPGNPPAAAVEAANVLTGHVARIARAGRLKVTEERAAELIHATGRGTTLSLLDQPVDRRDPGLAELAWEAVRDAITTTPATSTAASDATAAAAAVALRAALPETTALTEAEQHLLRDWLDRIALSR